MELSLLPIAALLLLLSGVGAPARFAASQTSSAALLRKFFLPVVRNPNGSVAQRVGRESRGASVQAHALVVLSTYTQRTMALARRVKVLHRAASAPIYATRFDVRTGAYLATAPPAA